MKNKTKFKAALLSKIFEIINDKEITKDWKSDDLKTTWLLRAKKLGLEGFSSELKDMFLRNIQS